jgi:acetyl esterase/lipase
LARRTRWFWLLALLSAAVFLAALLCSPTREHLRASSLLLRLNDPQASGFLAGYGTHPVDELPATVETLAGPVRARLYVPRGVPHPPGVVLLHGIHRLGIEEPRLTRFARTMAATGVVVLTPQIDSLADYRVDPKAIAIIGASAGRLHNRLGRKVGVMGLSFAGGLALLAAADPRFSPDIAFVVAVGAHDDLARVARFFATNQIEHPDGTIERLQAHEYGPLVLAYAHAEEFFAPADVAPARDAIRLWLWEEPEAARAQTARLSPAARSTIEELLQHHTEAVANRLLQATDRDQAEMAAVSPHGKLRGLQVPVFLLAGTGDNVIPATETLWLAQDVPPGMLRAVLLSPAIVHVEVDKKPTPGEQWALAHFMAQILTAADGS